VHHRKLGPYGSGQEGGVEVKAVIIVLPLLLSSPQAFAEAVEVAVPDILRDPKPFLGRMIRIAGLRCANEPKGLFACGTEQDGQLVRVESLALDFRTSAEVRRKLSASCRTPLAAVPPPCKFDAEFKPLNVRAGPPDTRLSKKTVFIKVQRMNLF